MMIPGHCSSTGLVQSSSRCHINKSDALPWGQNLQLALLSEHSSRSLTADKGDILHIDIGLVSVRVQQISLTADILCNFPDVENVIYEMRETLGCYVHELMRPRRSMPCLL